MKNQDTSPLIPARASSFEAFPESTLSSEGMQVLQADLSEQSIFTHLNVKYAEKSGMPLHLTILEPRQKEGNEKLYPLILYVQGSAWFKQNLGAELAQLARFARRGFVIAVVEYRPSPLAAFPAQVKDTKTAIRFMQENGHKYHADAKQITLWGDSSGGHTVTMVGVSLDEANLDDEPGSAQAILLKAVVNYYGPNDISTMNHEPSTMDHIAADSPEGMLIGGFNVKENPEKVKATVPMNYLSKNKKIPPFLILHGNKDRLVPFGQSVLLFDALKANRKEVDFYQLKGADHAGPAFWTEPILDIVETFIRKHL